MVWCMENGRVRLSGSGREVLEHPEIGALYLGGVVTSFRGEGAQNGEAGPENGDGGPGTTARGSRTVPAGRRPTVPLRSGPARKRCCAKAVLRGGLVED